MKIKHAKNEFKDIAGRLREIRINARLTQKEMGKVVGLTAGSVGALENGLYTPNYDVLRAIHKSFNISYDYIIDGVENNVNLSQLMKENKEMRSELDRLRKMIDKLLK